jgi:TatA/E family protein of Tat protein translocase
MNLGGPEILIVVAIAVLLFGAGWLPKAAKNLGKAKVEFDEVQRQFHETKDSVVEATGVKELESTMRKANKVINTSPQKMMKDAAKNAVTGSGATAAATATQDDVASEAAADSDDGIEDAEIVNPSDATKSADGADAPEEGDTNITVDFA